jgi:glycosyltransferase involved in cell wall biosynthesis
MITILMINTQKEKCGVYQFGKHVYDIINNSNKINIIYKEISSIKEFHILMKSLCPTHVLYNWHHYTMCWLTEEAVLQYQHLKHYFMFHTDPIRRHYTKYLFFGEAALNKSLIPTDKSVLLPRPLFKYYGDYKQNDVFTIGSFGFAFKQKGLPILINAVDKVFDNAIINLQMAQAGVADPTGALIKETIVECNKLITKPGIKINILTNYLDDNDVLSFLAANDINIFSYADDYSISGEGISSATDYALSVKRPMAITNCPLFRHFKTDDILLEKHTIQEIYNLGTTPIESFYDKWSQENLIKEIEQFFISE